MNFNKLFEKALRRVAQDPDVKDKEGTQPKKYYKDLSKSTKDKRDAHFKKKTREPAPGDARAKTKPSKHTKKFKQMFGEEDNPRIPRKKGQPAKSDKHSDLYTDEDPVGTIKGLGFKDVETAKASVKKIEASDRTHAHKVQAAVAMEQRARVMGKTAEAAVYRKYIEKMKKITKQKNEKAPDTDDAMKRYKAGKAGFTDIAHLKAKGLIARSDGTKRKSPKYESIEQVEEKIASVTQIQDRVDMYITTSSFAKKLADTLQKSRYNVTLEPLTVGFRVTVHFNPSSYKSKPYDKQLKDLLKKANFKGKPDKVFMFGKLPYSMDEETDLFEELKKVGISEKQIKGLKNKADKTGIPYGILKQVYDRGMAAWKTGHRPGAGQHQWAFARVNSFATKSKGTWGGADKDLADKVRAGKKR